MNFTFLLQSHRPLYHTITHIFTYTYGDVIIPFNFREYKIQLICQIQYSSSSVTNKTEPASKMKFIIAFVALFYVVVAAPPVHHDVVPIVSQDASVEHDGHFHYRFETGDGTKAEQAGELKVFDKDHAGEVVSGSVSYQGDDGKTYSLTYTADENGYHPQGDHIPVAPPVPEPILRALQYIAEHPAKDQH